MFKSKKTLKFVNIEEVSQPCNTPTNNIGEITGNKLKIGGWIVCRILNTGCPRRIKQIFSEDQYGHPMIDKIEFLKQFFK